MSDDLDAFRAKVALMREMGVTEADGIKLGPPVAAEPIEESKEAYLARIAKAQRHHHDVMFAASGTKPVLVRVVK